MTHKLNSDVMSIFTVLCYVRGDEYKQVFNVKVGEDESVATLKDAIKEKKSQGFRNVDADSLVLWNVSVPSNRHLKEEVEKLNLADDESLSPTDVLSDVFSAGVERKIVCVVVERPLPGERCFRAYTFD